MRRDLELYLAQSLRDHREQLEETLTQLGERREPLTPAEAARISKALTTQVLRVEGALAHDADAATPGARIARRVERAEARIRSWMRPRLGILRHYPPKALTVPASYLDVRVPTPAPTISIVTPSFRQGEFLERTLYSVLTQDYPALEYVVQDGGSDDGTVDVLRRFDGRLTSWVSEPDGGQGDAINRGFLRTNGEIMAWLNSDDLLLPGALAYVARYFVEHPDVDVVYGHRVMIDEDDGQIGIWVLPPHDDRALALADYVPQETLFWRRRVWDAVGGGVDRDFAFALDWDLLLRFQEIGARMVRLPRFIGAFRVHENQKTSATEEVGVLECRRLRQRVHGRSISIDEVLRGLRPYLLRHIVSHTRVRAAERFLPRRRVLVLTQPPPTQSGAVAALSGSQPVSRTVGTDPSLLP